MATSVGIRVSIARYVSDDPQPGIVECEFFDAHGRRWSFVEKTAIVAAADLDSQTRYPQPGVVACEIVGLTRNAAGREIVLVDTERPWDIESMDGAKRFEVSPDSLVEWDWGSDAQRPWDEAGLFHRVQKLGEE